MTVQDLHADDQAWVETSLSQLAENDLSVAMKTISSYPTAGALGAIKQHLLGLLFIRLENYVEALKLFKMASDAAPMSQIHFEASSYCAVKLGMLSDSVFYLKMSSTCPPPSSFEMQLLPEWMGSVEGQLEQIEENPFLQKAQDSYAVKDYGQVLQHLQQALNADPFNVEGWILIHKTMKQLGRKYDALHAVKAAVDSGDVPAEILAEASILATQLNSGDAEDLLAKARAMSEEDSRYNALAEIESHKYHQAGRDSISPTEAEFLASLQKATKEVDSLVGIWRRVNLGIHSGNLTFDGGKDPFIYFLLDLISLKRNTWLDIRVFSGAEFEDAQTNRLKAIVKDFRNTNLIDPVTLTRILRNEQIHYFWDFDGLRFSGMPEIHRETMIPSRNILAATETNAVMKSLVSEETHALEYMPVSFPRNFDPEKDMTISKDDHKKIVLALNPCELSDAVLDMFVRMKKTTPFFTLRLDTRKMGGISYLDKIESIFQEKGLQNFIEFVEVGEYAEEYIENLYGGADYVLTNMGPDSIQALYHGAMNNCNLLLLKEGQEALTLQYMKVLGLADRVFNSADSLEVQLGEELREDKAFTNSCHKQAQALADFCSLAQREKRVQSMVSHMFKAMENNYGADLMAQVISGEGST